MSHNYEIYAQKISAVAKLYEVSMIISVKEITNPMENLTQWKTTWNRFLAVAKLHGVSMIISVKEIINNTMENLTQ
jgi:hypothetical protein